MPVDHGADVAVQLRHDEPDGGGAGGGEVHPSGQQAEGVVAGEQGGVEERDWADTHREIAPLRRAEDAVLVDTSAMDFDESRRAILDVIRRSVEA